MLYADRLPKILLPKSFELEIQGQILALEYLRSVTDVNWSYATPARKFTSGRRRISRADFAVALIDEVESAAHNQQRFSVAY